MVNARLEDAHINVIFLTRPKTIDFIRLLNDHEQSKKFRLFMVVPESPNFLPF